MEKGHGLFKFALILFVLIMSDSNIIDLRHEIHQQPEVSNHETETARRIVEFMTPFHPDKIISLGTTGKAFVFEGEKKGKTIMFRAELDALPIKETNSLEYASKNQNVAHSCGHDGHMAILAGTAQKVTENRPAKGNVVFLFQPAEEVEQGARDVVEDPAFKKINPDYVFALHNIPGERKNKILLKNGTFAAASKGMTVTLTGKTAHAAEPENGISPAKAIAQMIEQLDQLIQNKKLFSDLALLTIIHIRMGEVSFGTTPGYADVMITLRAFENDDMELLTQKTESIVRHIASEERLSCEISYTEIFPAVVNDEKSVQMLEKAARENGLEYVYLKTPFRWSEDFSYFTQKYKGAYFGLGSGIHQPSLHNSDFDFPDEIIESGVKMFYSIYQNLMLKS